MAQALCLLLLIAISGSEATSKKAAVESCFGTLHSERIAASGFREPCAGAPSFIPAAPTQATRRSQINVPIGAHVARQVARTINLKASDVFTPRMTALFLSGGGVGGNKTAVRLLSKAMAIMTNTIGRPLFGGSVLASYGVWVNKDGMLMSLANAASPCRQINEVIKPRGYLSAWLRANHGNEQLIALYESSFVMASATCVACQELSGAAQLVYNRQGNSTYSLGMSVTPPAWVANYAFIALIEPRLAAHLPAYWQPLPPAVASAIRASANGQVPYADYRAYFD